jgi:hypothetical protein
LLRGTRLLLKTPFLIPFFSGKCYRSEPSDRTVREKGTPFSKIHRSFDTIACSDRALACKGYSLNEPARYAEAIACSGKSPESIPNNLLRARMAKRIALQNLGKNEKALNYPHRARVLNLINSFI